MVRRGCPSSSIRWSRDHQGVSGSTSSKTGKSFKQVQQVLKQVQQVLKQVQQVNFRVAV